ncbi:MAG: tetratricopeptide repeat protein [Woeseiaceae bacterium]|nr:tetratricopeptide repeat protein [Woeseiaceae bacterium]
MKLRELLKAAILAAPLLAYCTVTVGQTDAGNTPETNAAQDQRAALPEGAEGADSAEGKDGPITILDQTVPVADEDPDLAGPSEEPELDLSDRDLMLAEFQRFKDLQEAGVYDQAENIAKRIIEMSITQTGPDSNDTARALNNLGLVQHRMKNYEAAKQNFQSAIDIISDNEDKLSHMLINPLMGRGAAELESGRPDLAARTYSQATHISHVNNGPHNLDQIHILEALAETNLRMGDASSAKNNQDMIYALNVRHYSGNAMDLIEPLLRRASWQRRTGYILDERATYRRIIRIIETELGKDHISLIEPLTRLGQSYFFIDTSDTTSFQSGSVASGEIYFKRAERIAEERPETPWETVAGAKLALADYYNFRGDQGRARKAYREAWDYLTDDEERFNFRRRELERLIALNEDPIPRYIGKASKNDRVASNTELRQGRIVVSYSVNTRGRVHNLKIVEQDPPEFENIRRMVVREMRTRVYRPVHQDGLPAEVVDQLFSHDYYYLQTELDKERQTPDGDET